MCAIWSYLRKIKKKLKQRENLYSSCYKLYPRGPDRDEFIGIHDFMSLYLGFQRLAIMGITISGDQPFRFEVDGRTIYCMCNGEIFNFHDLIKNHSLEIKSKSDCEVIPLLYIKYGFEKMIKLLVGEFACTIIDIDHEKNHLDLYLGRDQLGIRPLFFGEDDDGFCFSSELKGIVTRETCLIKSGVRQFPPGQYMKKSFYLKDGDLECTPSQFTEYYSYKYDVIKVKELKTALKLVKDSFIEAVRCRLESDVPLGCLLSGGLDSSLVASIASRILKEKGKTLKTYSIGMPGSTDEYYAKLVAKFIGSDHTHIELTEKQFLDAVPDVVYASETFDITTIRATTGQYLCSKWIRDNTDIKVLLIGDGADELCSGYIYFHKAPTPESMHDENRKLLKEIHQFDVLRADRGIASCGLEARVPFLDYRFVDLYMSIDPSLRMVTNGMEKYLLRKSFEGYLPDEVLYRRKEAFSDGVSSTKRSWHSVLQEEIDGKYSDSDFETMRAKYAHHCCPPNKEALYFRELFHAIFGTTDVDKTICRFWLPNQEWVGKMTEPSARALDDIYNIDKEEKPTLSTLEKVV